MGGISSSSGSCSGSCSGSISGSSSMGGVGWSDSHEDIVNLQRQRRECTK